LPYLYCASKEGTAMKTRVFLGCSNSSCAREFIAEYKYYDKYEIQNPYCSSCQSVIERVIVKVA